MDCDFSHDPKDVPRLIAAAADADLVLGSRYVAGGRVVNWEPWRRFVSGAGSLYARALLGLPIRDLTGGFKCYRRRCPRADRPGLDPVEGIRLPDRDHVSRAARRLPRRELPISFVDREVGGSKMSRSIVLEAIWKVPALRAAALSGRL